MIGLVLFEDATSAVVGGGLVGSLFFTEIAGADWSEKAGARPFICWELSILGIHES